MSSKIQIGYGSDRRSNPKPNKLYGTRTSGKYMGNGGFNGAPTVDYCGISDDRFKEIFGNAFMPKWKRELIEQGESLD